MTTAIVHHPLFREHETGEHHPETPERYTVVMDTLRSDAALWPNILELQAEEGARGLVQACHTPQHSQMVERAVSEGLGYLDADTVVSMRSMGAALRAAGGVCRAV